MLLLFLHIYSYFDDAVLLNRNFILSSNLPCYECEVTRFAEYLLQNYGIDPDVTWILDCECNDVCRGGEMPTLLSGTNFIFLLLHSISQCCIIFYLRIDMEIHLILHGRSMSMLERNLLFHRGGAFRSIVTIIHLRNISCHSLPANPDGRVYLEKGGEHTLWKKNRNNVEKCDNWQYGVDPNRNFPFKWGECDSLDGGSRQICSTSSQCKSVVYRGPTPKSEVETKAILEYAASIFPLEQRKGNLQVSEANYNTPFGKNSEGVFIDVHSHGQYVGWPWGFINQRTPNDEGLGALGRKLASFNGYGLWAPKMPKRQCELLLPFVD